MIRFTCGKNDAGHSVVKIEYAAGEVMDALTIMRGLKQAFPDLYQQVAMEIILPNANGAANRIAGVEKPDG